jgi:hypothetical protein
MSTIKVNTVTTRSGSTLTLGESGKTVAIASGASTTGMGRAGAVDWQTSIKTTGFTAVSGEGYFCDTTSGGFTVTLPASPSAGDIVAVSDYAKTFDTQNLTIGRNGSNIQGAASDIVLDAEGLAMTFVYADATKGWIVVGAGREEDKTSAQFIDASGGNTVATCGNFKIHTFTGPGTFTVNTTGNAAGSNSVDYVIVGGGGGSGGDRGGGGGAGGYRESPGTTTCYTASPLGASPAAAITVTAQGYPIVVGGGGAAGVYPPAGVPANHGVTGNLSSALGLAGAGGGGGKSGFGGAGQFQGDSGGSGGGTMGNGTTTAGGVGNTPPVNPPQGNDGGASANYGAGGGGGAGAAGAPSTPTSPGPAGSGGAGGAGVASEITGSSVTRAGGGGGAACQSNPSGAGGPGGGGNANPSDTPTATAGTANTGGGGGGVGNQPAPTGRYDGRTGGSGIVIIRYKFQ